MSSIAVKALAGLILCGLFHVAANAQSAPGRTDGPPGGRRLGSGPVTFVSKEQFDQMVRAGTLVPVTSESLAAADRAERDSFREDTEFVEKYLDQHPDLTALAALARIRPDRDDPNVARRADGTYAQTFTDARGQSRTVINYGPRTKMRQLANSIRAASDPATQLRNYTFFYNHLPESFINGVSPIAGVAITPPVPPSQLRGAPLETVLAALDQLTRQWPVILALLPPSNSNSPLAVCDREIGSHSLPDKSFGVSFGDQTTGKPSRHPPPPLACITPDPNGIFANFAFNNKGALTCVKEQGLRGDCGVFSVTSVVEQIIAINTGLHVNLSEQDYWEQLTFVFSNPPRLYVDGYNAGDAITNAFLNNYQFAYEFAWDYNPSWDHPDCPTDGKACYRRSCDNYPMPPEISCSDTNPQAMEVCALVNNKLVNCGFQAAPINPSPYGLGPGDQLGPDQLQASDTSSVIGSMSNIWNPSGLVFPPNCNDCPPIYGEGPWPQVTVNQMIMALAMGAQIILGFEETADFGPTAFVPFLPPAATLEGRIQCFLQLVDQCTDVGGHAIHVVGFVNNVDMLAKLPNAPPAAGGGYFILKNSWSVCSGDAGYYYMPMDYVKTRAQAVYLITGNN